MITVIIFSIIFYLSNVVNQIPTFTSPPVISQPINTGSINSHLLPIFIHFQHMQAYQHYLNFQKLPGKLIHSSNSILHFIFSWFNKICGSISFSPSFLLPMSILMVQHDPLMKFQLDSMIDKNTFSEIIPMGYIPSLSSSIYNYTEPLDYQLSQYDNSEYFITINFNTNNNSISILEIMNDIVYGTNKTKQLLSNEFIYEIFNLLNKHDKCCLFTFNDTFNFQIPLDDQNIQHPSSLPNFTLIQINITSTPSLTTKCKITFSIEYTTTTSTEYTTTTSTTYCQIWNINISLIFSNAIMRLIIVDLLQQLNNILSLGVLFKILQHHNITILNNLTYHCRNLLSSFEHIELISCVVYGSYYGYISLKELLQQLTENIKPISTQIISSTIVNFTFGITEQISCSKRIKFSILCNGPIS